MFKTFIFHVDDSASMEARLQVAAALAIAHGAHLIGSASTGLSWPAYSLLTGSMAVAPANEFEALRSQARASLAHFSERVQQLGVQSSDTRMVEDEHRNALLLQSRYADLVVTSQDHEDPLAVRGLPQYLTLHGPRPVLVVPPSYALDKRMTENIVVGWDGSVPALRAITAALPLLARASIVRLVLVNPEDEAGLYGEEPGADMALYLKRHGAQVQVVSERTAAAGGDALLGIARKSGAGMLVSGAYGHSRFREIVLGGVTRVLLERATVPVLFAH